MASLVLSGDTSGSITVSAPAVAGSNTQTLVATTGTLAPIVSGTAKAWNWNGLTTNKELDFTDIPSWVKRITVMFSGVSTNGTSNLLVQIGAGSVTTSGYSSGAWTANTNNSSSTAGFLITAVFAAAGTVIGNVQICLQTGNTWVESHSLGSPGSYNSVGGGFIALSGTLDRVRVTTVSGLDNFDAGTINILYE